jgi:hypothetical protein
MAFHLWKLSGSPNSVSFSYGMIVADFEFVRHNPVPDFRLTLQRRHKFRHIAIVKPRNEAQKTCFKIG